MKKVPPCRIVDNTLIVVCDELGIRDLENGDQH